MIGSKPKILLVDDVEANLVATEGLLASLACQPIRAQSGNEALRLLLKHDFAVVLLDVQMPEMDGYEVARHARDNPTTRDVPIIFMTAMHETRENVFRGYQAGAFDLLFKPIDPYVLRSKVQVFLDVFLGRQRLRREVEAHKQTMLEVEAFNYSVSHDLRAPLRPLGGFSEALIEDYGDRLDEKAKNYLQRIRAAALRMEQLIEDLLSLSRISRGELQRRPTDLAALASAVVSDLRAADPARRVDLICPDQASANVDPRLLRIAMENLVRNAWKFTQNRVRATIELGIRAEPAPNETVYFIRDDGVGFDPAYAGKLFKPFQRLHDDTFEGTGIGLAIVERIIRRHEGRIWAESVPDGGATFYFTVASLNS
jgi:hypothetical protein